MGKEDTANQTQNFYKSFETMVKHLSHFAKEGYEQDLLWDDRNPDPKWHENKVDLMTGAAQFVVVDKEGNTLNVNHKDTGQNEKISFQQYREQPDNFVLDSKKEIKAREAHDVMMCFNCTSPQAAQVVRALVKSTIDSAGDKAIDTPKNELTTEYTGKEKNERGEEVDVERGITHFSTNDVLRTLAMQVTKEKPMRQGTAPTISDMMDGSKESQEMAKAVTGQIDKMTKNLKKAADSLKVAEKFAKNEKTLAEKMSRGATVAGLIGITLLGVSKGMEIDVQAINDQVLATAGAGSTIVGQMSQKAIDGVKAGVYGNEFVSSPKFSAIENASSYGNQKGDILEKRSPVERIVSGLQTITVGVLRVTELNPFSAKDNQTRHEMNQTATGVNNALRNFLPEEATHAKDQGAQRG